MNTTTTHTSNDTAEARFLAPETHQKTAAQSEELSTEEQAGDLRFIPLDKLVPSPLNVRKSGGANIDELAMLIDAQGLLQNSSASPISPSRKRPPISSKSSPAGAVCARSASSSNSARSTRPRKSSARSRRAQRPSR